MQAIAKAIRPLHKNISQRDFSPLLQLIGDAKVVMIGEASHGTNEFYRQRAAITQELITKKGFTFVVAEADWPDAYRVNRFVQNGKGNKDSTAEEALGEFKRFPLWMWRNTVVRDFVDWLRTYNDKCHKPGEQKVGFFGMDLYSFYSSMETVINYLKMVSPEDAKAAIEAYSNFDRFQGEPSAYGFATQLGMSPSYENEVIKTLVDLQQRGEAYLKGLGGVINEDELFYTQQNAVLVKNAEAYYRKMFRADENTWNIRDQHMSDTVSALFDYLSGKFKDTPQKCVIWAHNSHLGDARATDAGRLRGEWNVGQLLRQKFGLNNTFNIGQLTDSGTVTAASKWDSPAQLLTVRHGMSGSYEELFHSIAEETKTENFMIPLRSNVGDTDMISAPAVEALRTRKLERYIGVIYRPDTERASHYSYSTLPSEFDAVIFNDVTSGVTPLDMTKQWVEAFKRFKQQQQQQSYSPPFAVSPLDLLGPHTHA